MALVAGQNNQPCDVRKMRDIREEVGKKPPKKRWITIYFYDVTWLIFETLCPATWQSIFNEFSKHPNMLKFETSSWLSNFL